VGAEYDRPALRAIQNRDFKTPVPQTKENKMINIAKKIVEVYDWVLGPASTARARSARSLAKFNKDRMIEPLDF